MKTGTYRILLEISQGAPFVWFGFPKINLTTTYSIITFYSILSINYPKILISNFCGVFGALSVRFWSLILTYPCAPHFGPGPPAISLIPTLLRYFRYIKISKKIKVSSDDLTRSLRLPKYQFFLCYLKIETTLTVLNLS